MSSSKWGTLMKNRIILCFAFGLLPGMIIQIIAATPEIIRGRMQFQEVNIEVAGTAETSPDYVTGKNPRAVSS